jgi:hypothetical protein
MNPDQNRPHGNCLQMKKPTERSFVVETEAGNVLSLTPCSARRCRTERASLEATYAWMSRQRLKQHPIGRKRRRLFESSDELRAWLKEHPEETPQL